MSNHEELRSWAEENGANGHRFGPSSEIEVESNINGDVLVYDEGLIRIEVTEGDVPSAYISTQWETIFLHEYAEIEHNGNILRYEGELVSGELDASILEG